MAVDLGLNTLIAAVKNLPGNATGFADNVIAVLESFKSDDSNNNFGSAALKDVGVESGDVPELTVGGKLVSERLPGASTTQKGAVQLASAEQANALTDTTAALTPARSPWQARPNTAWSSLPTPRAAPTPRARSRPRSSKHASTPSPSPPPASPP